MPRGDRTGPMGAGPMTGRAAGVCTGNAVPGYANPQGGRGGFGRGMGFHGGGRGWRNRFYATGQPSWGRGYGSYYGRGYSQPLPYPQYQQELTPQQEIDILKGDAQSIQNELKAVNERIAELEEIAAKKQES